MSTMSVVEARKVFTQKGYAANERAAQRIIDADDAAEVTQGAHRPVDRVLLHAAAAIVYAGLVRCG